MSASYYLTTRYNNWVSRTMELACGMQVQLEGNLRQGGGGILLVVSIQGMEATKAAHY